LPKAAKNATSDSKEGGKTNVAAAVLAKRQNQTKKARALLYWGE